VKKILHLELSERRQTILEMVIIIVFAAIPAFATYPFRINIFLSYEGAYRMYLGHFPFKDFGIPLGYGYWIVPWMFFKIFGPFMSSLVKAQVFLNIISGVAFWSILKSLRFNSGKRFIAVFLFVISYSFPNFWPWYNHTVIVYELVGIAFLLLAFDQQKKWKEIVYFILAGLFLFLSFFTKQDGGFFAVVIGFALAAYDSISKRNFRTIAIFSISFAMVAALFILPLLQYGFSYWFNYGQAPHYSRINGYDIVHEFFEWSVYIKFYILIIGFIVFEKLKAPKEFFLNRTDFLQFLLTASIIGQAIILQVTSYTPPDGNIYFHSFCFAYILANVSWNVNFSRLGVLVASSMLVFLWWSGTYWRYVSRTVQRFFPQEEKLDPDAVISITTYKTEFDSTELDKSSWKLSGLKGFDKVYMPVETIEGIKRIQSMPMFQQTTKPKVLNMSELTPLAYELGFELEKGLPLWYHMNVGMFDKELAIFKERVSNEYYDLVLFEIVPNLNNFYPYAVRDLLKEKYKLIDVFQAPRRRSTEVIEVYQKIE
jgi:hypothetical protein